MMNGTIYCSPGDAIEGFRLKPDLPDGVIMEQRQGFRIRDVAKVHISDQIGFCTGTLKNFSESGVCISDLPRKIHTDNGSFKAVITGPHLNFKLQIHEQWENTEGLINVVGGTIEDATEIWEKMVKIHKQQASTSSVKQQSLHT